MVKKQINVVSLSHIKPIEDGEEDTIKDNDERAQIVANIKDVEDIKEQTIEPIEEVKPKTKRKTQTKTAKVIEEHIPVQLANQVLEPSLEAVQLANQVLEPPLEVVPESTPAVETKEKKIRTVELHKCGKCNKELTQRALRYTHPKFCPGQEINRNDVPVKRQARTTKIVDNVLEIRPDIIENHFKIIKENKLKERQDKISKLVAKIV
jgi:hypothetical protein